MRTNTDLINVSDNNPLLGLKNPGLILKAVSETYKILDFPPANRGFAAAIMEGLNKKAPIGAAITDEILLNLFVSVFLLAAKTNPNPENPELCFKFLASVILYKKSGGSFVWDNTASVYEKEHYALKFICTHVSEAINYKAGICFHYSSLLYYNMAKLNIPNIALVSTGDCNAGHYFVITENVPRNRNFRLTDLKNESGYVLDLWVGLIYPKNQLFCDDAHLKRFEYSVLDINMHSEQQENDKVKAFVPPIIPPSLKKSMSNFINQLHSTCNKLSSNPPSVPELEVEGPLGSYCDPNDLFDAQRERNIKQTNKQLGAYIAFDFLKRKTDSSSCNFLPPSLCEKVSSLKNR
ncbi:MAG: hypothetical protein Q8L78_06435 [Coxiellaceae bacterium]|nr:hypothetical protein [Coxiellaceae bacterium]